MAASATLQSFVATPMACAALRNSSLGLPSRSAMRIRCQAEKKQTPAEQPEAAAPSTIPPPPAPAISPPKPKASTSFFDVLAFSGPAPERINGRLAMIGFVTAVGVELASGNDLAAQLANGGVPWFFYTAALLSAASLVPLFKGVTVQSKSGGLFTADAEMWNGRLAMLGLVALAATEYFKGGPLV